MKWLAITVVVLLVGFLGYWLIELNDDSAEPETVQTDPNALGPAPESKPGQSIPPSLSAYSLEFGNLSFEYPDEWTLVEGADNNDSLQVVTIESPKDDQNYYYCIDFNEYGPGQAPDLESDNLSVTAVEPVTASGISQDLNGVFYQTAADQIMLWALIDGSAQTGDTSFDHSITNPAGRRLQVFGRFNCRDEQLPSLDLEAFRNSRLFNEAMPIFTSLAY